MPFGPRKGHLILVGTPLGVKGDVSARRPVDALVGEGMSQPLGLHAIGTLETSSV